MSRPYKYKAEFTNLISASSIGEQESDRISKASLDSLVSLIPEGIDLEKNIDIMAVAFNAAVVNQFNKNHDGMATDTALAVSEYFKHKPTNIEHNKDKVVGHIVSSGFSSYGDNQIIEKDDISGLDPFNISLASVIYKVANKDFANLVVESCDPSSDKYNIVSASWEIGFNSFVIALGSKNLNEAEVLTDEKHIKEYKKYLKAFEGTGQTKDGTEVYRLISGSVFPLGIGFTANPAADVKGLVSLENKKKEEVGLEKEIKVKEDLSAEVERIEINTEDFLKKIKNYKKNYSHIEKTPVTSDKAILSLKNKMDMKEIIEQLKETIEASSTDKFSEEAVANIVKVVSDAIRERSEEYVKDKAEIEKQKEDVAQAKQDADEKLHKMEEELASAKDQLAEVQAEQKAAAALDLFNKRMDSFDSEYELSNEDRQIIAEDLKSVDQADDSFASYQKRIGIIFNHKSKQFVENQEKSFEEKIQAEIAKRSEASTAVVEEVKTEAVEENQEEEIETALDQTEATSEQLPSNNGESVEKELSLKEKFEKAFSKESITIKY